MHRLILFLLNLLVLLFIGDLSSMLLFIVVNCIIFFFESRTKGRIGVLLLYNVIAFIGLCYILTYQFNYKGFFAPYGDDSFFYEEALGMYQARNIFFFKPYESFLSSIIFLLSFFDSISFLNVLMVNWLLPVLFLHYLNKFLYLRFDRGLSFKELMLLVVCNFMFQDVFVHMYRDSMIYLFTVLFLYKYTLDKKEIKFITIFLLSLVFLLRGANGFLLLFYVVVDKFVYNAVNNSYKVKFFKTILLSMVILIVANIFSSFLIGYISRFGNVNTVESFSELSAKRQESFFENISEDQNTVMIYNLGVAGYPLRFISQIYSPISFKKIEKVNFRVSTKANSFIMDSYKDFTMLFYNFSVVLWVYWLPNLSVGVYRCYKNVYYQPYLIYFILAVSLVTFISLQPRHRLMFILFYSIFWVISKKGAFNVYEFTIFKRAKFFSCLVLLLMSILFLIKL